MTYRAGWERYVRLAVEATYNAAPASGAYNELGAYFAAPTTSPIGSLRHIAQRLRTIGTHGKRTSDQMAPIPASKRSEGSMDFPFAGDFGGALLYAAFGGLSSADTPDPGAPLSGTGAVPFETASPTTFSLDTQPDGGCFFEFVLADVDVEGTIVITGTDMDDQTLVETINITTTTGTDTYYSRNSFKTVITNGIVVTGPTSGSSGTITVNGYQKTVHTITLADTQKSIRLEEYGDPGADTGKSWWFGGQLINALGLSFDASVDDGLLVISPSFVGQYPDAASVSTYQLPVKRAYPAWTASADRSGAYARLLQMNMNINLGAILRRTAQGSESPQQPIYGARQIQGTMRILVEDNTEYSQFINTTLAPFVLTFTTPYKLGDTPTIYETLVLTMSEMYLETYEVGEGEEAIEATLGFYSKEHVSNNAIKAVLTNNVPDGVYD